MKSTTSASKTNLTKSTHLPKHLNQIPQKSSSLQQYEEELLACLHIFIVEKAQFHSLISHMTEISVLIEWKDLFMSNQAISKMQITSLNAFIQQLSQLGA